MLSSKAYVAIAVIVALMGLYGAHRAIVASEVKQAVQQNVLAMNSEYQKKLETARAATKKTEDELRLNALQTTKEKDAKIATTRRELDVALERLRTRPERPSPESPSAAPGNSSSCTGMSLYRADAEFLTREAARAQSVLIERDYYYKQYEDARKKLDGQK